MRLVEFSVTNFRSITSAHKIRMDSLTVLVGKNNEGKSNLLKALNVAMQIMLDYEEKSKRHSYVLRTIYNWEIDFPIQLQSNEKNLESIFRLDFQLDEEELSVFHKETGIRDNGEVPIEIKINQLNQPKILIPKKGSPAYKENSATIVGFISKRISFNYIQAIRTEEMAIDALIEAIRYELGSLYSDQSYQNALKTINKIEQKAMDRIAKQILSPMKTFLPDLREIKIEKDSKYAYRARTRVNVIIDDGLATNITYKGDGIKSLVTMAILQNKMHQRGASIIAIEEPESHLHSGAIHSLVEIINKMSTNNQVIISTHNPLFVRQNAIQSNIIVNQGKAAPAKSIAEIRKILGVLPSDNLRNAQFVLVVEGEEDKLALNAILPVISNKIKTALDNNNLIIKPLGGASNLSHDLADLMSNMCQYVVLLDNDKAGKEAAQKAIGNAVLKDNEVKYTICNGMTESEFEDCLITNLYRKKIEDTFSISLNVPEFRSRKMKWSDRLRAVFLSQGTNWDAQVEQKLKRLVVESIPKDIKSANGILIKQKSGFINGLVNAIEKMLGA